MTTSCWPGGRRRRFRIVHHDGIVATRHNPTPDTEPPQVRIISDNPLYAPYEGTAEEVNIIGRIRWYAREI